MEKHIVIKSENTNILKLALDLLQNLKDLEVKEIEEETLTKEKKDLQKAMLKMSSKVFNKYID